MDPVTQCQAMALAAIDDATARRFAHDPAGTLRVAFGLSVVEVTHLQSSRRDGGWCDGLSFLSDGVIQYRPTGNRRENFTIAHEFGHWLVDQTTAIYDILGPYDDASTLLEVVCDRIAASLLIQGVTVNEVLNGQVVSAEHLARLHDSTRASRPVCAIALAERLPALGAVVLLDPRRQVVEYASISTDPEFGWPTVYPWRGQFVPDGHPLRRMSDGGSIRVKSFWADTWGRRAEFYIDARAYPTHTVVVLSDLDLWAVDRFHPPSDRYFDQRPSLSVACCGERHSVRGWPCGECKTAFCPICGNCQCGRQASREVACQGNCFMRFHPSLLEGGLCENCR